MKTDVNFFDDFVPYWNTVWLLVGVGFIGAGLESFIGYQAVGFLFLFAVLVVGFLARLGPVFFAATISWLTWNFFFIPPRFTFAIAAPEDIFMGATFFLVAIATGLLANRIKRQEIHIREREERTKFLYEVMLELSETENKTEFLTTITRRLAHTLGGACGILLKARSGQLEPSGKKYSFSVRGRELEAAETCFTTGKVTGWSTEIHSEAEALYLPVKGNNETVGVFRFQPAGDFELTLDQENLLQSVCRQIGINLEQRFVQKRLAEAEQLRESEKIHQTLLNSISHEFRTPLSAIVATASVLGEEFSEGNQSSRLTYARELKSAAERLNRVVENLLDMSRLSVRGIAIKKEWHDVQDLIGIVVARVRESFSTRNIHVDIAENVPLIEIDFRLLEHALFNLVVNACSYTREEADIAIVVRKVEESICVSVEDSGPGLPPEYIARLFEMFFRPPNSPPGGTGLGLSIAKSIVEFHGGTIRAENRFEGGARFQIRLPYHEAPHLPEEST